ncbi:MAG: hypothetical protein JRI49_01800, partial [Deltaproteobacteria bacterium]|nr:hypothetical protein [Deltaproteobacteria bacterium]
MARLPACPPCPSSARELTLVSARELTQAFYEVVINWEENMDVITAISERASIRGFNEEPVSREV